MVALNVIKQLICEFETLLPIHLFNLQKTQEMASRWLGPGSPIVPEAILDSRGHLVGCHKGIPVLDEKLFELEYAHSEYHAKLLIKDILRLADKERLKCENANA